MNTEPFTEYACSLGTVTSHQAEPAHYIICNHGGETIGIPAAGEMSPDNVEADIAAAT